MTRRKVLTAGAGVLIASTRALAQSAKKPLRVGYATLLPRSSPQYGAFLKRMSELGYQEGENFTFEFVQISGIQDYPSAYAQLAARGCDILFATGNEAALRAALSAGPNTPVVFFALDYDPFEKGFVATLARPGGNATGIFVRQIELAKKRVELTREALPKARTLGLLWDAASHDQATAAAEVARRFDFEARLVETVGEPPDYGAALSLMAGASNAVVLVPASPQFLRDRTALFGLLGERRLPAIAAFPEQAQSGALLSYGVGLIGLLQSMAPYIDRIASGAKPADIPVEQPTHFDMTINLKAAKALDLAIPHSLLARADEVIE